MYRELGAAHCLTETRQERECHVYLQAGEVERAVENAVRLGIRHIDTGAL